MKEGDQVRLSHGDDISICSQRTLSVSLKSCEDCVGNGTKCSYDSRGDDHRDSRRQTDSLVAETPEYGAVDRRRSRTRSGGSKADCDDAGPGIAGKNGDIGGGWASWGLSAQEVLDSSADTAGTRGGMAGRQDGLSAPAKLEGAVTGDCRQSKVSKPECSVRASR